MFLMKIMGFEMEKCSVAASEVDDSVGFICSGVNIEKPIFLSIVNS